MKFKNIKAFSHNFSHSYVSFENYVDGEFVFKDLRTLALEAKGDKVSIYWVCSDDVISPKFNDRIEKSIKYYKEWLPKLMLQHEIDSSMIDELRTDIFVAKNHQIEVQAYARDINGKEYIKNIYEYAEYEPYTGD